MRRVAYTVAGVFLIVKAIFITARLYRGGALLMLAGVSPALLAAFALGWLLVLRNLRPPPPPDPTTPEEDS